MYVYIYIYIYIYIDHATPILMSQYIKLAMKITF